MTELKKQFDYYVDHQDELVQRYNGRWVVIANEVVVDDFDSEMAAYTSASERFAPGSFMIQRVAPGQENYSQTFYSRVAV